MARKSPALTGAKLSLVLGAAGLAISLPSAGMAFASFTATGVSAEQTFREFFTPASVDPQLARRVTERVRDRGFRFTPAGTEDKRDRTVTVAVRMDSDKAQAISVRSAIKEAPGKREAKAPTIAQTKIEPTRYNLGIARGYQSFARPIVPVESKASTRALTSSRALTLPDNVRKLDMPDLAEFEPGKGSAEEKPSRFKPRISLEDKDIAGRSEGTLQGQGTQSVDVGGSYSVTRNLDVTAGVRISQDNDRLAPLTDTPQDSQAVYVGTQFRF
jgi:hypothetical protein